MESAHSEGLDLIMQESKEKSSGFLLFMIIWLGDFVSTIGSGLTAFALGVYAFKTTGYATASAMVVLCNFLPAFLLRPVGGVLADRVNRLSLMMLGSLGSALGVALILVLIQTQPNHFLMIYPGIILSSVFFAFQNPAYKSCVSDFIPSRLYSKASGLVQLSSAAQFLISPLLAGVLMSVLSIKAVLLIDVMTFLFAVLVVLFVKHRVVLPERKPSEPSLPFFTEMVEGFRATVENRGILILLILLSLLLFYIGLIEALSIPLVLSFTNTANLGIAQSVSAIGMLVASIVVSVVERKRKNTSILATSLLLLGFCFSFIGIVPSIWAIIIPSFLFFCTVPFANSSIDVLIRKNIDNEKQGRVWSMISVITSAGSILAYSVSGFLADKVFNPLFMPNGWLANSFGHVFGVGAGRGIAFIFFLSGILVMVLSLIILKSKSIRLLDSPA